jgi:hypothetical protein
MAGSGTATPPAPPRPAPLELAVDDRLELEVDRHWADQDVGNLSDNPAP